MRWVRLALTTLFTVARFGLATLRHMKVIVQMEKINHLLHAAAILGIPLQRQLDQRHRESRMALFVRRNLVFQHEFCQGIILGDAVQARLVKVPMRQGMMVWPQRIRKSWEKPCYRHEHIRIGGVSS